MRAAQMPRTVQQKGVQRDADPAATTASKTKTAVAGLDGYDAQAAALTFPATSGGQGGHPVQAKADTTTTSPETTEVDTTASDSPGEEKVAALTGDGPVTRGGQWSSKPPWTIPAKQGDASPQRGGGIRLEFTPGPAARADSIGLVQTSRVRRTEDADPSKLVPYFMNDPNRAAKAVTTSGEEGRHIDRSSGYDSPYFGEENKDKTKATTDVRQTAIDADAKERAATDQPQRPASAPKAAIQEDPKCGFWEKSTKEAAWLLDNAKLDWTPGRTAEAEFEVAAIARSGPDAGVFYGSVSWGFKVEPVKGEVTVSGPTLVSAGLPSKGYRDAAAKWNAQAPYDYTGKTSDPTDAKGTKGPLKYNVKVDNKDLPLVDALVDQLPTDPAKRLPAIKKAIAANEKNPAMAATVANLRFELEQLEGTRPTGP